MADLRHYRTLVFATILIAALFLISPVWAGNEEGGGGGGSGSSLGSGLAAGSGDNSNAGGTSQTGNFVFSGWSNSGTGYGQNWAVDSCSKNCPTLVTLTGFQMTDTVVKKILAKQESDMPPIPEDPTRIPKISYTVGSHTTKVDYLEMMKKVKATQDASAAANLESKMINLAQQLAKQQNSPDASQITNAQSAKAYLEQYDNANQQKLATLASSGSSKAATLADMGLGLTSGMEFLKDLQTALPGSGIDTKTKLDVNTKISGKTATVQATGLKPFSHVELVVY